MTKFGLNKTSNTKDNNKLIKSEKDYSVFKIYLIYFISMLAFSGVRILASLGFLSFLPDVWSSVAFTLIIQAGIMLALPFALYLLFYKGEKVKDVLQVSQVKKVSGKVVLLSIALGVVAFFINIIVSTVFNLILSLFGYGFPSGGTGGDFAGGGNLVFLMFLLEVVLIAVFPAICEEFLHRGILLGKTAKIGYKKAIVISSLLFALVHFNINQVSYAFIIGLVIAVVAIVTKSIWPAVIIHFTNNFISLYLSYAAKHGWALNNFYEMLQSFLRSESWLLTIITASLFVFLIVSATLYLVIKLFKETTLKNVNKGLKQILDHKTESEFGNLTSVLEKQIITSDILINKSNLNLKINKKSSPLDVILPINRNVFKPQLFDNSFLYATILLGGLSTFFTFVWGLIW